MFEKRKSLKDTGTPAPHEEVNPVEESMEELEAAEAALDVEGLVKAAVDGIERVQV